MSTEIDTRLRTARTIAAREIKRRGIGALDDDLREGPVHVIRNDRLAYVIMLEEDYQLLMEDAAAAEEKRAREALEGLGQGSDSTSTASEIIHDLNLE